MRLSQKAKTSVGSGGKPPSGTAAHPVKKTELAGTGTRPGRAATEAACPAKSPDQTHSHNARWERGPTPRKGAPKEAGWSAGKEV